MSLRISSKKIRLFTEMLLSHGFSCCMKADGWQIETEGSVP